MRTIILVTYTISPYKGSESSVSWNYVCNMQVNHKLFVIYCNGKEDIEQYISEKEMPNVTFIHMATPTLTYSRSWLSAMQTVGRTLFNINAIHQIEYAKWHYKVFETARQIISQEHVDIVHYLNPIGFREPGYCWKIKDVPYVWGPLQGVENRPIPLFKAFSLKERIYALVRRVLHNGAFILRPRVRQAMHRADYLFAATPNTVRMIKKFYGRKSFYLPENGILQMNRTQPIERQKEEILQIVWIGALCPRKALIILLDTLSHTRSRQWHLDVIGDGNLFKQLKEKSEQLGIDCHITWHGSIPRTEVLQLMKTAHLHVISSLGEGNPTVLWEAMSWAVPTMTLDHCGMVGVVCEKCGIKIPIHSYKQVVTDMAEHIDHLIEQPEIIGQLSQGVIECSEKFMWSNRIKIFNEVYERICNKYSIH